METAASERDQNPLISGRSKAKEGFIASYQKLPSEIKTKTTDKNQPDFSLLKTAKT